MAETDPDKLLTSTQVAELLGVSRQTVVRNLRPSLKAGRVRYYTLASIPEQMKGDAA